MSGLSGGRDNFNLVPMRQDGQCRVYDQVSGDVEVIGGHSGDYAVLNIANPVPGFIYQWVANRKASHMAARAAGGVPVNDSDPDGSAAVLGLTTEGSGLDATPIDSVETMGDVVLYRYPEARMAERMSQNEDLSLSKLERADMAYLSGADAAELQTAAGRNTRFARRDHTTQMLDESGNVRQNWNPSKGIVE